MEETARAQEMIRSMHEKQTKNGSWYKRGRYGNTWYDRDRPARANLAADTDAVSPVIAVILMVAITVVLAATVFILVSDITAYSDAAPNITFAADKTAGTLTVTHAPTRQVWQDFIVTGCDSLPAADSVDAGDVLANCAGSVTISYRGSSTTTLVYSGEF